MTGPGRPRLADGEKTIELRVRVPESTISRLDEAAGELGKTRSEAVREAVDEWLPPRRIHADGLGCTDYCDHD